MTEHCYSEPPIEHTNANFPPAAFPSVHPDGLLNEPPDSTYSEARAFDLAARAYFQGATTQARWLRQYVDLVQSADNDQTLGFVLGQIAQLGSQAALERAANGRVYHTLATTKEEGITR